MVSMLPHKTFTVDILSHLWTLLQLRFSESLLMNHVILNYLFLICMDPYWIIHLPFLSGQFLHNLLFFAWMLMTQSQPYTI
jgi:hypothetical protein